MGAIGVFVANTLTARMQRARPDYDSRALGQVANAFWSNPWIPALAGVIWAAASVFVIVRYDKELSAGLRGALLTRWSYGLTVDALLLIAFVVAWLLRSSQSRLSSLVIGADKRLSTSKTQYLIWTVGVAFALLYVAIRTSLAAGNEPFTCPGATGANCVPAGSTWQQYVLLLGIPAAAAVAAKGVAVAKGTGGSLQQTGGSPSLADLATDETGQADLGDVQYLIFNLIAFVYFAAQFFSHGTLVQIPDMLLGLTGASAATFVVNKAVKANPPVIKSVTPTTISPGQEVKISGANLLPDVGEPGVTIDVGGVAVAAQASATGATNWVSFTAPYNMQPAASASLTVRIDSSGASTDPYPGLSVAGPAILGWDGAAPAADGQGAHDMVPATIRVSSLARPPEHGGYAVNVAGVVHDVEPDYDAGTIPIPVPRAALDGQPVPVRLMAGGVEVATASLPVG
jgi:IPT/TIG domain